MKAAVGINPQKTVSQTGSKPPQTETEDPPKYLVNSLEDFLVAEAMPQLQEIMEQAKEQCSEIFKAAAAAAAAAKAKLKAGGQKKKAIIGKRDPFEKTPKKQAAELAQKLVMDLVDHIENHRLLKEGVFVENLKYGHGNSTGSDNIVSGPRLMVGLVRRRADGTGRTFHMYIYIYQCLCVQPCLKGFFQSPSCAGGQSSLMLLCPTKLCIREGSIHWPWMCTCFNG